MTLHITQAALHELLTDAHKAMAEHRHEWAGTVLHVLRRLTMPEAAAPQGLARRLRADLATGPAPSLAAEEAQPAHHHHLQDGPGEELPPADAPPSAEAPPIPAPAPEPAQAAGGFIPAASAFPVKWTPERLALFERECPTAPSWQGMLDRLNALPGPPIASVASLREKACSIGLRRTPETLAAIAQQSGRRGGKASVEAKPQVPSAHCTPEREALFRALWPDPAHTVPEIHRRINALPGPRLTASQSLYNWAKRFGLPSQRPFLAAPTPEAEQPEQADAEPTAEPPPQPKDPDPAPEPVSAAPATPPISATDEKAEVFDAFDAGQTVRDVAADFGLPLTTLGNWHAEWKLARKDQSA